MTYITAMCCGEMTDALDDQALHGNTHCSQAEGLVESDVWRCCL